jgi:hypothetical protein
MNFRDYLETIIYERKQKSKQYAEQNNAGA